MNTTIQLSKETKQLIADFGSKDETYEQIIKRMHDIALKAQLKEFLLTSKDTLTISQARAIINGKS